MTKDKARKAIIRRALLSGAAVGSVATIILCGITYWNGAGSAEAYLVSAALSYAIGCGVATVMIFGSIFDRFVEKDSKD